MPVFRCLKPLVAATRATPPPPSTMHIARLCPLRPSIYSGAFAAVLAQGASLTRKRSQVWRRCFRRPSGAAGAGGLLERHSSIERAGMGRATLPCSAILSPSSAGRVSDQANGEALPLGRVTAFAVSRQEGDLSAPLPQRTLVADATTCSSAAAEGGAGLGRHRQECSRISYGVAGLPPSV